MRSVQNQKSLRVFTRCFLQKLQKEVKQTKNVLSKEDLAELAQNIITKDFCKKQEKSKSQLRQILTQTQETIVEYQQHISYLKRKIEIQDQLTKSFIQNVLKDKNNPVQKEKQKILKKQTSVLQLLPVPMISGFSLQETEAVRSPSQEAKENQTDNSIQNSLYRQCSTSRSRSRLNKSRFQISQYAQQVQPDDKQKNKALAKLRKLERYVFEKQGKKSQVKDDKMWNYGVSPTKKFIKQQNNNLKVVNANLTTHLSLLQKFRDIPSIQGLVARQQALKKKETILKELDETLTKKELELNKKQSQFLKRQKSTKIL